MNEPWLDEYWNEVYRIHNLNPKEAIKIQFHLIKKHIRNKKLEKAKTCLNEAQRLYEIING